MAKAIASDTDYAVSDVEYSLESVWACKYRIQRETPQKMKERNDRNKEQTSRKSLADRFFRDFQRNTRIAKVITEQTVIPTHLLIGSITFLPIVSHKHMYSTNT